MIDINENNSTVPVGAVENWLELNGYRDYDGLLIAFHDLADIRLQKIYGARIILEHSFTLFRNDFSTILKIGMFNFKDGTYFKRDEFPVEAKKQIESFLNLSKSYEYTTLSNAGRSLATIHNLPYTIEGVDKYIYKMVEKDLPILLRKAKGIFRPHIKKGRM